MLKDLEKENNPYQVEELRKIYIEENYYEQLYKSIMKESSYETLLQYEKYLIDKHGTEILKFYKNSAKELATKTGKLNYKNLVQILKHIKTLTGGEEIAKDIVEECKIKYANRKLMLEELKKA